MREFAAAVLSEDDPRAAGAVRVVPRSARVLKVGNAVLGYKAGRPRGCGLRALRLAEIKRIIKSRHGGHVDTDDGSTYLDIAFAHMPDAPTMRDFAKRWTPRVSAADVEKAIDQSLLRPRRFSADNAARALRIYRAERDALRLRTIGAIDFDASARAEERKQKDRNAKSDKRAAIPRVASQEAAKPWLTEGISRATWFRRQRAARETDRVCNNFKISTDDKISLNPLTRVKSVSPPGKTFTRLSRLSASARELNARLAPIRLAADAVALRMQRIGQLITHYEKERMLA